MTVTPVTKMNTRYIYSLNDPTTDAPKYIGSTKNLSHRLGSHIIEDRNKKKVEWIASLKLNGLLPKMEIIDTIDESESSFWEEHYIFLYRSWGFDLFNRQLSAKCKTSHTEQSKKNMSIARKGKMTAEQKLAFVKRMTNPEVIKQSRMTQADNGTMKVPVVQYDLQGNFIKTHKSATDAWREVGLHRSRIYGAMYGRNHKGGNYMWLPLDGDPKLKINPYSNNQSKPIVQYSLGGDLIKEWFSGAVASRELHISESCIHKCCRGSQKQAAGFIWKLKNIQQ